MAFGSECMGNHKTHWSVDNRQKREQKGYDIDRKRITIVDDVKELGTYKASIDFGNGKSCELEFEVVAE